MLGKFENLCFVAHGYAPHGNVPHGCMDVGWKQPYLGEGADEAGNDVIVIMTM